MSEKAVADITLVRVDDGNGIASETISYGVSDSESVRPESWQSTLPEVESGKVLWARKITDYTDPEMEDTVTYIYARQGINGAPGAAGTSVKVSSIQYQAGTSPTTAPTGTWSNSIVTAPPGQYLWTKTTFSDGKIAYGIARQGINGAPGISVTISNVQYQSGTSSTTPPDGAWSENVVPVAAGQSLWTKTQFSDGTVAYSVARQGLDGADGTDGANGIIVSNDPPINPHANQLWQKADSEPIKRWNGNEWVVHKMSIDNLNVEKLSALSADLGDVKAGTIYGKKVDGNKTTEIDIDVDNGYITVSKLDENNIHKTVIVKDGTMMAATQRFNGSARNGIRVEGEKIVSVRDYYNETTNQTFHHENNLFEVNNIASSGGMTTELFLHGHNGEKTEIKGFINTIKTFMEKFKDTGWVDLNSFIKYRVKNGYCTVVVNCRGHMNITSNGNGDVLGVLPEGARPALELGGSATSMDYGGYETQWWVNSNGTIKATYLKAGATRGNFSFVVNYPV